MKNTGPSPSTLNQFMMPPIAVAKRYQIAILVFVATFGCASWSQSLSPTGRNFCAVESGVLLQRLEEINRAIRGAKIQIYKSKSSVESASELHQSHVSPHIRESLKALEVVDEELAKAEKQSQNVLYVGRHCSVQPR
jgi:hypothetical protein